MSAVGIFGVPTYFSFENLASKMSDRDLVLLGVAFIATGCAPLSLRFLVSYMNVAAYVTFLILIWNVAYPMGQTASFSPSSKTVFRSRIGGSIGLFSTGGTLSPLLLSVFASRLWENSGRESVFLFILQIDFVSIVVLCASFGRLAQLTPPY